MPPLMVRSHGCSQGAEDVRSLRLARLQGSAPPQVRSRAGRMLGSSMTIRVGHAKREPSRPRFLSSQPDTEGADRPINTEPREDASRGSGVSVAVVKRGYVSTGAFEGVQRAQMKRHRISITC